MNFCLFILLVAFFTTHFCMSANYFILNYRRGLSRC